MDKWKLAAAAVLVVSLIGLLLWWQAELGAGAVALTTYAAATAYRQNEAAKAALRHSREKEEAERKELDAVLALPPRDKAARLAERANRRRKERGLPPC